MTAQNALRTGEHTCFEFFASGGMVRAALGSTWRIAFANDVDVKKADAYRANWGSSEFLLADIESLTALDLPIVTADLPFFSRRGGGLLFAACGIAVIGRRGGL